jgi:hypothetical protein
MDDEIVLRILNNDVWLDEECWRCNNEEGEKETCTNCNGKGFELTSAGRAILELIERHK